jgi:GTP pyrophosphokinase
MVKIRDDLPKTKEGTIDLAHWIARIAESRDVAERQKLTEACAVAFEYGANHLTAYEESCLRQGLVCAEILSALHPDMDTLIASILYFSFEYAKLPIELISKQFGESVANLILGVAQISETQSKTTREHTLSTEHQRDSLRRMLLAVVEDVRVVLIKLAERISALRASYRLEDKIKLQLALETRDIYAPLANRLGIGQIKWELEDFAFRYIEPNAYKQIAQLLDERRVDREHYIHTITHDLRAALEKEGVSCEVVGRAKHIYSIWRKMMHKDVDFKEIYDVRAVRVLVNKISDCYAALGVVHSMWQPIPQEFDDYIATPKENGYRSLHTAVIGPNGKSLEVQIRTFEMHQESELGVAAHWRYKEGGKSDPQLQKKLVFLRQILENVDNLPVDDSLKSELFEDRVYVFTPKGKVIDLPKGSTPLDFAYQVHTDIGHRCRGAKIHGQMVPLNRPLKSGDQVEIVTTKEGGPSRDWINHHLGYLFSSRAKGKVLAWFKRLDREKNVQAGQELINKDFKRLGIEEVPLVKIAQKLNFKSLDDMYNALGIGELKSSQIINAISPQAELAPELMPIVARESRAFHQRSEITIQGVGDLKYHYGHCCKPLPGDPIIGYITIGKGITIHRQDCLNVLHTSEEGDNRLIEVSWGDTGRSVYPVDIMINAYDRQGLLRDITNILSVEKVNIIRVNTFTNKLDNASQFNLTIEIPDLNALGKVLNKIAQLPNVMEVSRAKST